MINTSRIKKADPELYASLEKELNRQRNNIELIASENFVSENVMLAVGSVLTNKYAEGYPGHRYYGGCACVDIAENLAIERAKKLFGAEHANVQPHSGANANFAVYFAVLQPGDTIMGMSLAHGGHLTHGSPVTVSGKHFNAVGYGVKEESGTIDYDDLEKQVLEVKPKIFVCGASAYPRILDFKRIREICDKVGAYMMVDIAHIAGLVATGLHPSPVRSPARASAACSVQNLLYAPSPCRRTMSPPRSRTFPPSCAATRNKKVRAALTPLDKDVI